jgi:hypothetical protein
MPGTGRRRKFPARPGVSRSLNRRNLFPPVVRPRTDLLNLRKPSVLSPSNKPKPHRHGSTPANPDQVLVVGDFVTCAFRGPNKGRRSVRLGGLTIRRRIHRSPGEQLFGVLGVGVAITFHLPLWLLAARSQTIYERDWLSPSTAVPRSRYRTGSSRADPRHQPWTLADYWSGSRRGSGSGDLAIMAPEDPGRLVIWDAETGAEHLELKGHTFWITSVAFSPDGRHLASGSADRTIKIWELPSGRLVHTLEGHQGGVKGIAYSPDGAQRASGGDNGSP